MNNIFTDYIAMDCFCCDIIEAWIKFRKSRIMPYDKDSESDWIENEFMCTMEFAFRDCSGDEEDDA